MEYVNQDFDGKRSGQPILITTTIMGQALHLLVRKGLKLA